MVNLVHILVQRPPVESAVEPVVPSILHDEEDDDLVSHLGPVRERHAGIHSEVFAHRVEEPNLGKFDSEVGEKNHLSASPLLSGCRSLGLHQRSVN